MVQLYLIPEWFINISILMELIITLVSFGIAFISWKVYKISNEREVKFFSLGFLSIAISYLLWSILNLVMLTGAGGGISALKVSRIQTLGATLLVSYFVLLIIGWVTLNYATFKSKGLRNYVLLIGLSLLTVYLSANKAVAFYYVSIFLVFMMLVHYYLEYFRRRNVRRLLTFISFLLILIGRLELFFSADSYLHYMIGHSVELLGYGVLLINLLTVLKSGQEKK
ncbi:MAG: hypothetical protein AABW73_03165 [Nanoarchaeota archaeon]